MSGVLDELRNGLDYGKVAAELKEFITETERVTSKQVPHFSLDAFGVWLSVMLIRGFCV